MAIREAERRQVEAEERRQQQHETLAAARERAMINEDLLRNTQRVQQLMERFNALMDEGRYREAEEDVALEAGEIAPLDPVPRLATHVSRMQGALDNGLALRVARQPTETKVRQRRALYDDGLVRAQQMAVAIGGWRELQGFEGFDLNSYAAGVLDHAIGDRPVFANDPQDKLELEAALWAAARAAEDAGVGLAAFLERQGWADEKIQRVIESPEYQARLAQVEMASVGLAAMKGGDDG